MILMKTIIGKFLLVVMAFFVLHDFMTGQEDLMVAPYTQIECQAHTAECGLTHHTSEHQVFHTLALTRAETPFVENMFTSVPELATSFHRSQTSHLPPDTPPKTL